MFSKYFPREFFSNLIYQNRNYFAFSVNNFRDIFVAQNFSILAPYRIILTNVRFSNLFSLTTNHCLLTTSYCLLSTISLVYSPYSSHSLCIITGRFLPASVLCMYMCPVLS